MKTLESLKAEQAAAIAKLEREIAIAALCPVTPERVQLTSGGLAIWAMYHVDSLADALPLMARFEVVPFWQYRGTFTRMQPEEMTKPDEAGNTAAGPFAASLRVSQGSGYGPDAELKFFFKAGADMCQAHVKLGPKGRPATGAWYAATPVREGAKSGRSTRIINWTANNSLSALSDKTVKWGTGSKDSADYEYAFAADWVDGGTEHATGQLWNLVEEQRRATFKAQPLLSPFLSVMLQDMQATESDEACSEEREARDCGTIWTVPESTLQTVDSICRNFFWRLFPRGTDTIGLDMDQAGSDLYLEMAGHGAGFSDRTWSEDSDESRKIAETLTAAVNGRVETYIGDDGRAYISGGE